MDVFKSDRIVFAKVHDIFNILRFLCSNNMALCDSIDEAYEEILLSDLALVPEQYDSGILTVIEVLRIVLTNINFFNISNSLDKLTRGVLSLEINSYEIFNKHVLSRFHPSKQDLKRINNLTNKFKPLFKCIDAMFEEPLYYLHKIAELTNSQYDDIL